MSDLKFTVKYGRRVQTRPYENMTIGLEMEFPIGDFSEVHVRDKAFELVRNQVERWIDEALNP